MARVHCDITQCEYCRKAGVTDFVCVRDEIELIDNNCITFGAHVDMSPEYRISFWKRMSSRQDKHECKQLCENGKRYVMVGLVWFTDQDDRYGTDEIWFTEEKSGLRCKGMDIREENAEKIRKTIASVSPVSELPEAKMDDL